MSMSDLQRLGQEFDDNAWTPCPFCGGDNDHGSDVWEYDDNSLDIEDRTPVAWGYGCSCGVSVGPFETEAAAIAAWNKRAVSDAAPELIAAMQGVMNILNRAESNASGNPEWNHVGPRVAAFRAAIAKASA